MIEIEMMAQSTNETAFFFTIILLAREQFEYCTDNLQILLFKQDVEWKRMKKIQLTEASNSTPPSLLKTYLSQATSLAHLALLSAPKTLQILHFPRESTRESSKEERKKQLTAPLPQLNSSLSSIFATANVAASSAVAPFSSSAKVDP